MTSTTIDDPAKNLAERFNAPMIAAHIGPALTCGEVNTLADFLESQGHDDGARQWLAAHDQDCDEPDMHETRKEGSNGE